MRNSRWVFQSVMGSNQDQEVCKIVPDETVKPGPSETHSRGKRKRTVRWNRRNRALNKDTEEEQDTEEGPEMLVKK